MAVPARQISASGIEVRPVQGKTGGRPCLRGYAWR